MKNLMEKLYNNLDEAVAFAIDFKDMIYHCDDSNFYDYVNISCEKCENHTQIHDIISTKSYCKKEYGELLIGFGVSIEIKNDLIEKFDIREEDFRAVRNKVDNVIYYQITPTHTMLPNSKTMDWHYEPCSLCNSKKYWRKVKFNEKKEEFYYISQEVLEDLHDINVSYERFSGWLPIYVVSRRVYEYFAEYYPRAKFSPMFLKKDE